MLLYHFSKNKKSKPPSLIFPHLNSPPPLDGEEIMVGGGGSKKEGKDKEMGLFFLLILKKVGEVGLAPTRGFASHDFES